nr:MAG TPA: hypothetical protein [Caudoviricetes sp.]
MKKGAFSLRVSAFFLQLYTNVYTPANSWIWLFLLN